MEEIVVTKERVTQLLKGLNPSKALGLDELHPRVLKELATELGQVFAHLFQLLKGLNPSKALGLDELHPRSRVLKELATELGQVFAHLFQQSLDTGETPSEWTLANICHLFKKGDRSLACNYRQVSFTCIPCKLLEHSVC